MSALGEADKRIKVAVRVRPVNRTRDDEKFAATCIQKTGENSLQLVDDGRTNNYQFDYVFDEEQTQIDIYNEAILEIVDAVLDGRNASVLAYGQTGSGKTFTMLGEVGKKTDSLLTSNSGVLLRVLTDLFMYKQRSRENMHVVITLSVIEIYDARVRDLLQQQKVLEVYSTGGIQGLSTQPVESLEEVLKIYETAQKYRSVAATAMNAQSSRSHALFMVDVVQQAKTKASPEPPTLDVVKAALSGEKVATEVPLTKSRLCLVDLAGSERPEKSKVQGQQLQEAIRINQSLLQLGIVVKDLYLGKTPSYRTHKLTTILKEYFQDPQGKLLVCTNLSPISDSAKESLSTLRFADQVKGMKAPTAGSGISLEEMNKYLERLKTMEELCADLRVAAAQHGYVLQAPTRLLSDPKKGGELRKELKEMYHNSVAIRMRQQEEQRKVDIIRMSKEIAEPVIKEIHDTIKKLEQGIKDAEQQEENLKQSLEETKKEKEKLIEEKTSEAKKKKKERKAAEEKKAQVEKENMHLKMESDALSGKVDLKTAEVSVTEEEVRQQKEDLEELRKIEEHHSRAQSFVDKLLHLRNHQADFFRMCIESFQRSKEAHEETPQEIGSKIVDAIVDRSMRIAEKQASYEDGEGIEHTVELLPMEQWPHPLKLVKMKLPDSDGEPENCNEPDDSDYETDSDSDQEAVTVDNVYSSAAKKIGASPQVSVIGSNGAKVVPGAPVQYDFTSARKKKEEEEKKKAEEAARAARRQQELLRNQMLHQQYQREISNVTKMYDSSEAEKQYIMNIYDCENLCGDVIAYLQNGTTLVKHGRNGKPHKRRFWLNQSKTELCWADYEERDRTRPGDVKNTQVKNSSILLQDITAIVMGQYSKVFKRQKECTPTSPEFYLSFTIVVKNGKRTVDCVAENIQEFEACILGLANLVGIEPTWGKPLGLKEVREEDAVVEKKAAEELDGGIDQLLLKHHVRPSVYTSIRDKMLHLKQEVEHRFSILGDWNKVFQDMGGIHPPRLNSRNALLVTKGELRYHSDLDIFRTCLVWKVLEQEGVIFDPNFKPPYSVRTRS